MSTPARPAPAIDGSPPVSPTEVPGERAVGRNTLETLLFRASRRRSRSSAPTWRQFKQWIGNPAITYTTRPRGLMRTASFMARTGQLPGRQPTSWRDLVFPPVYPTKGS